MSVAEASLGPIAGALVGYASFGILVVAISAIAGAMDADVGIVGREDWKDLGFAAGALTGVLLLVAYLYGGFVAGRMARTAGISQGILVFVAGVAMAVGAAALVNAAGDGEVVDRLEDALRTFGAPGSWEEWGQVGTVAGISSLVGMLVGSLLGSRLGERGSTRT